MRLAASRICLTTLGALLLASAGSVALHGKPKVKNGQIGTVIRGPIIRVPDVSAVSCHGAIISGMAAETQNLAQSQSAAISYWTANAAQLVGPGYSDWNNAQQKVITCAAGNTSNSHRCTAKANPCTKVP